MIWLEKVNTEDDSKIATLAKLSDVIWNAYYPAIISQEQIDYMLQKYHSTAVLKKQISDGHTYYIIQSETAAIGYCGLVIEADFVFLNKLYLLPNLHAKGIGSQVFDLVQKEIGAPKKWRLQVNRKNIAAINFYFKLGFKISRAEDFAIGDGYVMEDFVMEKD